MFTYKHQLILLNYVDTLKNIHEKNFLICAPSYEADKKINRSTANNFTVIRIYTEYINVYINPYAYHRLKNSSHKTLNNAWFFQPFHRYNYQN